MSESLLNRVRRIEGRRHYPGILDETVDMAWVYAGGDPDFPWDWLRDPLWREVARDDQFVVFEHRDTAQRRAIYRPPSDAQIKARGADAAFL
jgi:hypothetical protein